MSDFPTLRTGATLQYPTTRTRQYTTRVFQFVDGTEQRCRVYGSPLTRWELRFEALDETEMRGLQTLFESEDGRLGTFTFRDPWSGTQYASCSLADDQTDLEFVGENQGQIRLTVKENRS
jgi:hypothetical protein